MVPLRYGDRPPARQSPYNNVLGWSEAPFHRAIAYQTRWDALLAFSALRFERIHYWGGSTDSGVPTRTPLMSNNVKVS